MILKTLTRKLASYKQLISYVMREDALGDKGILIPWNLKGQSIEDWVKEFEDNEKLRQLHHKHNIKLIHTVIALAPDDSKHVDEEVLKAMALKYVSLRGLDSKYLIVSHHDADHHHLHLVESPLDLTGKNKRMSIESFQDMKKELQLYQQINFPELHYSSLADHGKKHREQLEASDKEYQIKLRNGVFHREVIRNFLSSSLEQADGLDDWFDNLKENQYEPYYRGGKLYGVEHEGRRFRFNKLGVNQERIQGLLLESERSIELASLRNRPLDDRFGIER
ncbi:MAG: hypothetical protein K9J17_02570 [Flavobacteriales bacterium]|nr:hypothetical protein [Flavobacteriales bacterium]